MHVDIYAFVRGVGFHSGCNAANHSAMCYFGMLSIGGAANHPWSFSWPENAKRMKLETQRPPEGCGGGGIRGGVNGTHFSIAGSLVIVPGSVLDEQASEIS